MPGKSRHGKGKHPHYSKKSKALRRQGMPGTAPTVSQAAAGMPGIAGQAAPAAAVPAPKAAGTAAKALANPYPFITSELRRIALLGGVIIVILVVLSLVLK
jgi:hypothetical protein